MCDVITEQLCCCLCPCPGMGWGQVDVMSTQNSCVVACVNVLGWGQVEVLRMQICPVFRARVSGHPLIFFRVYIIPYGMSPFCSLGIINSIYSIHNFIDKVHDRHVARLA